MAHVSRKLTNSFEGALAGGGDPATSPLYVFGPFLRLIVVAGVASVTFGASVWLVVMTIAMVSAMYRLVMAWVVDGSGGSGLSEEEFGGWAVKLNASITFIEYTLTFLVSMAALVTFIADRFPFLNESLAGIQYRTLVAIVLSVLTGWLVNRGPKMAARAFGPATAGVLILLWVMVFATIWKLGFRLPHFDLAAFTPGYIGYTFGGYARILAVMTGIEIFANLVAAYDGPPAEKSRKAFGSLLIIMGTTGVTMLIVGPAIFDLSDPTNPHVSVFTQTMDQLLPAPLPYIGTLVGVAVLLSASAASAQGLQNLALGLKYRHYIPAILGQRNRFDVADKPVWIEVAIVALCFLLFGTHEETYLAIYAAGVFILLSMTGWAATKRLLRHLGEQFDFGHAAALAGTIIAAILTTGATLIIFYERFTEGAWTYLLFIPILYFTFDIFRRRLGDPTPVEDKLGRLVAERRYLQPFQDDPEHTETRSLEHVLLPLDGSAFAEQALPVAQSLAQTFGARLTLMSVEPAEPPRSLLPLQPRRPQSMRGGTLEREEYLGQIEALLYNSGLQVNTNVTSGHIADEIVNLASDGRMDVIVMSTSGRSGLERFLIGSVANEVIQFATRPILLVRPTDIWRSRSSQFKRLLVSLDGSVEAEEVLPYARTIAQRYRSTILLLSVPETVESEEEQTQLRHYLDEVAISLQATGLSAESMVTGSGPARTIVSVSETEAADLIMMATHGRSRMGRMMVGSVADRVVRQTTAPVFLVPVPERRLAG
ncbi:MAG TPA: universal stress protein [Caldilineae bacterium]|nr:universal stress protein [Caldilineae bacterium]